MTDRQRERRKFERFKVLHEACALTANNIGQIIETSKGGFSLFFQKNGFKQGALHSFDIVAGGGTVHIKEIPVKCVWVENIAVPAFVSKSFQRIGTQFQVLSQAQKNQIDSWIDSYEQNKQIKNKLRYRYKYNYVTCCAICKKIKSSSGKWLSMHEEFYHQSKAKISHGYCPSCAQALYGKDFDGKVFKSKSDGDDE